MWPTLPQLNVNICFIVSLLFEYLHFELQYSLINTVTVRFCMYAVALINKVGGGESDGEVLGDHDRYL